MTSLLEAIRAFEKAGEEVRNAASIAVLSGKLSITNDEAHELMDRLSEAEINGSRAERLILEAVALSTAIDIIKSNIQ